MLKILRHCGPCGDPGTGPCGNEGWTVTVWKGGLLRHAKMWARPGLDREQAV